MIALLFASALACDDPRVQYDGKTFTATFCTDGAPWAGATLRRASDGAHVDLPAVATEGREEVTLKAEVGPGFVQYVLATWHDKQTPCTSERAGCRDFGYVLDNAAWTWPRYAYDREHEHELADFQAPRIRVLDAGGGESLVRKAIATVEGVDGGKAGTPRAEIEILYRARWDRPRAWRLAYELREAEVGFRWTVKHWPEAPEAFVIAVGGS